MDAKVRRSVTEAVPRQQHTDFARYFNGAGSQSRVRPGQRIGFLLMQCLSTLRVCTPSGLLDENPGARKRASSMAIARYPRQHICHVTRRASSARLISSESKHRLNEKRFRSLSGLENRRAWRNLHLPTPRLGEFVGGVILYDETLGQRADDGSPLPALAARQGIVPGIKVIAGKIPLALAAGDEITQSVDGLAKRLDGYKQQGGGSRSGARSTRCRRRGRVDSRSKPTPSACPYAAVRQDAGVVPIVEPEVLIDGDHSIARRAK